MGRIISFANQKGGVGKTTSAVNTAASLGLLGHRALLVDLDPQGSATSGVGVAKKGLRFTVRDLLVGGCPAEEAVVHTEFAGLDLIPANISLAGTEFELLDRENGERALLDALQPLKSSYDYIIVDCPPSLGMLTVNAMVASDGVVIPMQCEYYALEGLSQLTVTIGRIKQRYNPRLSITGILITMYNKRLSLSIQVMKELKRHYGDRLFETTVARNVRIPEAPSFGMPVYYHDKRASGAKDYLELAKELTRRA